MLGLKALIEPFKICFAIIPVMPQPVLEYLSAPVPLLVGLPNQLLTKNKIDYFDPVTDFDDELNWINLDDEDKTLWKGSDHPIPF